jgi:hypothetical protein
MLSVASVPSAYASVTLHDCGQIELTRVALSSEAKLCSHLLSCSCFVQRPCCCLELPRLSAPAAKEPLPAQLNVFKQHAMETCTCAASGVDLLQTTNVRRSAYCQRCLSCDTLPFTTPVLQRVYFKSSCRAAQWASATEPTAQVPGAIDGSA